MSILSNNIKVLRQNAGYTQRELAEKISASEDTISSYERAVNIPPLDQIIAISRLFGVSIDTLVGEVINIYYEKIGELNASKTACPTDSKHEIYNAHLHAGAVLHRFQNCAGVRYSAVYKDDIEIINNPREREYAMIARYQEAYNDLCNDLI